MKNYLLKMNQSLCITKMCKLKTRLLLGIFAENFACETDSRYN